jgi:molybdopterin/thiamine biosynthesis adenylyltransferase
MGLSDQQIERYQRHILLKEIGGPGQQKLTDAKVALIGMGGLGNPVAQYLAAAGIGTLGLVDDDHVSLSNLQRQTLFCDADIGAPKVQAAARALTRLNPHLHVKPEAVRVTPKNVNARLAPYDVVAKSVVSNPGCKTRAARRCHAIARWFPKRPTPKKTAPRRGLSAR